MKNYIRSSIDGKGFFKTYILFLIPILIAGAISQSTEESSSLMSTIMSFVESYLSTLLHFAFFCYLIRFVIFKDNNIRFSGAMNEFAPRVFKWSFLSWITLGLYGPWYIKNTADYVLERVEYEGKNGRFLSNPKTLLKYMLLTLYLPMAILTGLFVSFLYRNGFFDQIMDETFDWTPLVMPIIVFSVVIILALIPFIYFYFSWVINIRFGGYKVVFNRSLSEMTGFLIPQLLLSVVTVFIYYPAAAVKIYRYLLEGSSFEDESGIKRGGFGFDGDTGQGFSLLWGQILLTVITIGIYGPWAGAKLTNWFLNNTRIETT